ncbi:MAG: hypothetical protein J2P27_03425, partial [Actinobacteria bacterium]|nr:hypothetical protein [Actinomycetota bacterium]
MTNSAQGIGWPERLARHLGLAGAPGRYSDPAGMPGLGWPGVTEGISAAEHPGNGHAYSEGGLVFRNKRGQLDPAFVEDTDRDVNGEAEEVPERVRQALAGVSRETVSAESELAMGNPAASGDTPIAQAARAAVVARTGGEKWEQPSSCRVITIANQK